MKPKKSRRPKTGARTELRCPVCDTPLKERRIVRQFDFGVGEMKVPVTASVVVQECEDCGAQVETAETGREMEDAGRRAIGMLVGDDFTGFRQRLGLSFREMSRMTGIGTATLSRWEAGRLRPNRSLDLLMRILRDVRGAAAYALNAARMPAPKRLTVASSEGTDQVEAVIQCHHNARANEFRARRNTVEPEVKKICPVLTGIRVA
jgi:putative zinc finger/helix-turn-helix YgiT family protein